jgi:hypothetical protein
MSHSLSFTLIGLTGLLCLAGFAAPVTAVDLGNSHSEVKGNAHVLGNPGTPDSREGGEDIDSATVIPSLPYTDTGNTCDNIDDYEVMCPFGSDSPDVVYAYTPEYDDVINIDLCGSSYDTKLFVFCESEGNLVACNDDYYFDDDPCGEYVSFLENVVLYAGFTYYIVIDGYSGDCGDYILSIFYYQPCIVDCPAGAVPEGEPQLMDGYVDTYNGGCNSTLPVFQNINWTNEDGCAWLCGISGWFESGDSSRDTDWFPVVAMDYEIEWTIDAEFAVQCYVVVPDYSCPGTFDIPYEFTAGPCLPNTLSFTTNPGEEFWLWVGPTTFGGPVYEFTYFMTVCGIQSDVIPTRQTSLGILKNMYR